MPETNSRIISAIRDYGKQLFSFIRSRVESDEDSRGRGHKPGWYGGRRWKEKWMNMTDEERSTFREEWKRRCGR